eukprot:4152014-Ditylum_brightwellii.AAC.1
MGPRGLKKMEKSTLVGVMMKMVGEIKIVRKMTERIGVKTTMMIIPKIATMMVDPKLVKMQSMWVLFSR